MKNIIALLIFVIANNAQADTIISLAAKNGTRSKETTNSSTTTPIVDSKGKVVGYSTDTSNSSTSQNGTDVGLLIQVMPNSGALAIGVGYFQDGTGLATIGLRFK